MESRQSAVFLWACGVFLFALGVFVGLALHLKYEFLGNIPETTVSAIGSVLGAALGVAGTFAGAYYLWQKQIHRTEQSLGEATAHCVAITYAGLFDLAKEFSSAMDISDRFSKLPAANGQQVEEHIQAIAATAVNAKTNIGRISQQLGALGATRVPWFIYTERMIDEVAALFVAAQKKGLLRTGASDGSYLIDRQIINESLRLRDSLAICMEELKAAAPSLGRFQQLP